jgi:hypothetical protein
MVFQVFNAYSVYLEPLNIFLYTWRFLSSLEVEEDNLVLKMMYRWWARVSILVIPMGFYGIYIAFVVESA